MGHRLKGPIILDLFPPNFHKSSDVQNKQTCFILYLKID